MGTTIPEANIDTKTILERLRKAEPGELVTYAELSEIIGRDVRATARGCLTSAMRGALREGLVFSSVKNEGVRLLPDDGIAGVGLAAVKHIGRAARRAGKKLACVRDFDAMPNAAKVQHNMGMSVLGAIVHSTSAPSMKRVEATVEKAQTQLPIAKTLDIFRG